MKQFAAATALAVILSACTMALGQAAGQSGTTAASTTSTSQTRPLSDQALQRITQEVRHQLVMLPFYSVFDNLEYKVAPDGTVTLLGQVLDPTLKPDAERAVKKIEGVERVVNDIEVLPTSPNDDHIRRSVYRAIYGNDVLAPYSLRAVPPIHIIVKNGHVTLTGVVARQMDKQIAEMQAKSVPGVFSVNDNLQVENPKG
jgi:hyperosmotically inducible periplasmic protein